MRLLSDARRIAEFAIGSALPSSAVRRVLTSTAHGLRVGHRTYALRRGSEVQLIAIGKAAGPMLDAAREAVGTGGTGVAFTPRGYPPPRSGAPVHFGDHPVPGSASLEAGRRLLELVEGVDPDDLVLFLLSGGGSATVEVLPSPLVRSDLALTTRALLASGAPIGAMNAVRRHLSLIKGGQLALRCRARRFATVAISDVVGDAPEEIASGPTVADPSTFQEAMRVVGKYHLTRRLPHRVLRRLRAGARGALKETPKPGDRRFRGSPFVVAATNRTALHAAAEQARALGYRTRTVPGPVVGETQIAARRFARALLRAGSPAAGRHPVALLAGGETTVTLGKLGGRGGRNVEFALVAAKVLAGRDAVVLSVGSDGIDGTTGVAGGWVDGATWDRARSLGLDLPCAVASHRTFPALRRLEGLIRTGPTGTNVTDVHVGLIRAARRALR